MNALRIGSLFSGIGGLELGLEMAGIGNTVYQCEIDAHARSVLARHWPGVPCHDDVTTLDPSALPAVDLICGGFPCQDISVAAVGSERDGLQGARSGLWSHMARIIEAQRPEWVVVENVAHGAGRWVPGVVGDLGRLGYETLPVQLEARHVGREHVRRRVFLLAHANGFEVREQQQRMPGGRARELREEGQALAMERSEGAGWDARPDLLRVADGIPEELDGARFTACGNAVVPQCAEVIGAMIAELRTGGTDSN